MNKQTFTEIYKQMMGQHAAERPAIIVDDMSITFGQLRTKISIYKDALISLGVKSGTRVAYSLPNCPQIFYLGYAMAEIGGCLIPMHPATPVPFMKGILGFGRADYLVVSSDSPLRQVKELPCVVVCITDLESQSGSGNDVGIIDPVPDDLSFIISTSGTTAQPKFVPITQENFATVIDATRYLIEPMSDFENGLTYILLFPLSSAGVLPSLSQLLLGSTYVLTNDFSPPNFCSLIEKWKIDGVQGPPAYFEKLLSFPGLSKYDLSSVTRFNSGSDYVPNKLIGGMKTHFKNLEQAGIGYGLAETSTIVMAWRALSSDEFSNPTTVNTVIDSQRNEIKIVDDEGSRLEDGQKGELYIRGESVIKGYYNNPEVSKEAFDDTGWFKSGDMGIRHNDGTIELLGRKKFAINRGGRSISPVNISALIMKLEGVRQAAVVGVPHKLYGEMIWAFVTKQPFIKKQQDSEISEGRINRHCRENLPPYMVPDNVVFLDELPRTRGAAKIDYEALKKIGMEKLQQLTGDSDE